MKLATLKNGTRDGTLVVVSRDLTRAADVSHIAKTMQLALENWDAVLADLTAVYDKLNDNAVSGAFTFNPQEALAPLPRCHQFIDASAFLNHGNIMEKAFDLDVKKDPNIPILIQRQSDDFMGPHEDYAFPSEEDNAYFENRDTDANTTKHKLFEFSKFNSHLHWIPARNRSHDGRRYTLFVVNVVVIGYVRILYNI